MILGVGTDIVAVARMEQSLQRMGQKFARRLLTEQEFNEFVNKKYQAAYLAKRFAAKEAAVKALGTGFAQGITWKQVSVANDEQGAPVLRFTGLARDKAQSIGVQRIHLSLSDEKEHALAFVVLESA